MTLTIVTSYVNYYRTPIVNHHFRLQFLQKILNLSIPVVIFVTPDCLSIVQQFVDKQVENKPCIIPLAKSFFESSYMYLTTVQTEHGPVQLPAKRFQPKDTLDYMCYQHSKVEFINKITELNPFSTTYFAWCDYDLFRHWDCPQVLKYIHTHGLGKITHRPPTEKDQTRPWSLEDQIFFPGCWSKATYMIDFLCNHVCWRFSGGFFLGNVHSIQKFHRLYLEHFPRFLDERRTITWDVNFWALLEQSTDWEPYVYEADHNVTMISNFPLFAFASRAKFEKSIEYPCPTVEGFHASSCSVIQYNQSCIMNVRYVNYWYKPDGHCDLSNEDGKTCTTNRMTRIHPSTFEALVDDSVFRTVEETTMGLPEPDPDEQFQGVEDIRLYTYKNELKFIATTVNYSGCATNRMIYGDYNIHDDNRLVQLENVKVMRPPYPTHKEKNWIPFHSITEPDKEYFIYSWFPFRMGIMKTIFTDNEDGTRSESHQLDITHHYNTVFPLDVIVRGSTNFMYVEGEYIGLVHVSEEKSLPKRYFHMIIWLDGTTYRPLRCSKLFYFDQYGPEFCLSMDITRDHYVFWISRYDRDPLCVWFHKSMF